MNLTEAQKTEILNELGGNAAEADVRWESLCGKTGAIARRFYHAGLYRTYSLDDLLDEGVAFLFEGLKRYDPAEHHRRLFIYATDFVRQRFRSMFRQEEVARVNQITLDQLVSLGEQQMDRVELDKASLTLGDICEALRGAVAEECLRHPDRGQTLEAWLDSVLRGDGRAISRLASKVTRWTVSRWIDAVRQRLTRKLFEPAQPKAQVAAPSLAV